MIDDYRLAQGPAKPASAEDLERDAASVADSASTTYPNLHRRIDEDLSIIVETPYILASDDTILATENGQLLISGAIYPGTATYALSVNSTSSYRTTTQIIYNEDSTTSEIP